MIDKIQKHLTQIEQDKDVRILFAVEAGSRAWGFASPDSDYDIRFIYVKPRERYLKAVGDKKDTIERTVDDLDFAGWDILKALSLANKSNPNLMEWLYSPIIYRVTDFYQELMYNMIYNYSQKALVYHYGSLAKRTWHEHLQEENAPLKKYFYALRPVICVMHLQQEGYYPPVEFDALIKDKKFEPDLAYEIKLLLEKKKESSEYTISDLDLTNVREFICHWMYYYKEVADTMPARNPDTEILNELGVRTILS